jgi:hypothetical protein
LSRSTGNSRSATSVCRHLNLAEKLNDALSVRNQCGFSQTWDCHPGLSITSKAFSLWARYATIDSYPIRAGLLRQETIFVAVNCIQTAASCVFVQMEHDCLG